MESNPLVLAVFKSLATVQGVAEAIAYRRDGAEPQRSTQDGRLTRTTADIATRAMIGPYRLKEIMTSIGSGATAIQPADAKCVLLASELGLSIECVPQDRIVRADGSLWNVISVQADKSRSLWTLQLRRP